ncbi:MAG: hypothetical protein D4R65_15920 [Verrucomicrobiaceae bacterium]|nr:MAG: hypothetical protein D4R65_15920 [Verrucomicrobiaceae bacterium]
MNRKFLGGSACASVGILLCVIPALGGTPSPPTDSLWDVFQNPPTEARASCYWWWKGDLTADEMGRQLRLLKDAGLGGAHIIPWQSSPAYLSPEWLKLLRAASDAARKEGMILDLSANAMWPFRGVWVPEEESLHKVALETFQVQGPTKFLPPKKEEKPKKPGEATNSSILLAQLAPDPVTGMEQMRDVTAELTRKDSPGVDVPAGKHTLRVVRQLVNDYSDPSFGSVPDHFNPKAIENYLKGFADRVAPALDGKLGNGLRALYCDSIEIKEANWTPNLPEEFQRRNGYDLMPYLPLVLQMNAGKKPPAGARSPLDETIARVRYDYCRTLVDMFLDGMGRPFYRWCHENGVLCRWQAYGFPWFYGIDDGYLIPDMPEGNSWLFPAEPFHGDVDLHGWPLWQKYASSGAHLTGRPIASTEAMTVVKGKFEETLDLVKRADDFNFVCGINHSFLHGFCYSPANEPFPGRNQFGTYFSEQNTWWPYMRRWMDYNARLNAVFQASKPVAQVALLFGVSDIWAEGGLDRTPYQTDPPWAHKVWRWINQNGANADYVSDRVLQQAKFNDGKIDFGPMSYEALIVLGAQTLVPATAEALDRYARAGGKIVFMGALPDSSPGLKDASSNDEKVRAIVQNLLKEFPKTVIRRDPPGEVPVTDKAMPWIDVLEQWRKSTSVEKCLEWTDRLMTELQIHRSVQFEKPGLYQIQYRHDGSDLYFFANTSPDDVAVPVALPLTGKHVERWDPETGSRSAFPVDKDGRVLVSLPVAGSLLLVASEGKSPVVSDLPPPHKMVEALKLTGPWSASFQPANGAPFEIADFPLAGLDQSKDPRLNRFAGRVIYRTEFHSDQDPDKAAQLDLGEAPNCVSEVTLNGKPLGVRWYGRHLYALDGALKRGLNKLEVTLATTLFNNVRKKDEVALPSGLVGPVTLRKF